MYNHFHWNGSTEVRRKYWYEGKRRRFWHWGWDWYHYLLQDAHDRKPLKRGKKNDNS